MAVNAVAPQQSKKGNPLVGTLIGAGGGALGGYAVANHLMADSVNNAKKLLDENYFKSQLRETTSHISGVTEDMFESHWKSQKDHLMKMGKDQYEEVVSMAKKTKVKYAAIGAAIGAAIVFGVSKLFGKKNKV